MEEEFPHRLWTDIANQLRSIREAALWRELLPSSMRAGARIKRAGRCLWNFSSNNYLDLAAHPHVVRCVREAAERFGTGAGGSRLITGTLTLHEELEARLAAFKQAEAAVVFSSGYLANIGLVQVLSRRADGSHVPIVFDKLVHASLIDAVTASGAPWHSFAHNDIEAAERVLRRFIERHPRKRADGVRALIVTEGVFSMDGDVAPLADLYRLAEKYEAFLVVDDAHGTGVVGEGGAGAASLAGVAGAPLLVQVGTLSKALGSQGGFVAGPRALRDLIVNRARAFIYDTALAPVCAAAALAGLDVIEREPDRLAALAKNSHLLRSELAQAGLGVLHSPSAIVPLVVGAAERTLYVARTLEDRGFLCVAIRPPTVPPATSRVRMTVMATHPAEAVRELAQTVGEILRTELC